MLFNSIDFLIFLPIVFMLYWFVTSKNLKIQNAMLLLASYFFYASWNWKFLFLLLFSTGLDYFTGIKIAEAVSLSTKKVWFWLSITINLGFLMVFKYYNFFIESFTSFISQLGFQIHATTLNIILPIGISFYTFHGLSYVIDIYKKRIEPERDYITYALFVSYFPLLVAGPIERATHLLPQIKKARFFNYSMAIQGLKQIVWGLFKKIVIADNCAFFVNQIFNNYNTHSSSELIVGSFLFAFQIYGDFSGYSDIALGVSKLFGINLLQNFNFPYFARDIADFWRRWHISLSSWFRDYLYIPLGGNKGSKLLQVRNTFTIFIISGFWHGANWTFVAWGFIHALLFLPLLLFEKNRVNIENTSFKLFDIFNILKTFLFVSIAWIFFRSTTIENAIEYIKIIITFHDFSFSFFYKNAKYFLIFMICIVSITTLLLFELKSVKNRSREVILSKNQMILVLFMILFMGSFKNQLSFIYFQF